MRLAVIDSRNYFHYSSNHVNDAVMVSLLLTLTRFHIVLVFPLVVTLKKKNFQSKDIP